jgi:hypothetical protein
MKQCYLIARGSVFECEPLLELCRRQGWVMDERRNALREELEILAKMLSALIRGTDEKREHQSSGTLDRNVSSVHCSNVHCSIALPIFCPVEDWLGDEDSNLGKQSQSLLSCR